MPYFVVLFGKRSRVSAGTELITRWQWLVFVVDEYFFGGGEGGGEGDEEYSLPI